MVYEFPPEPDTDPVFDMVQLARQTLGDDDLRHEVLALFARQIEDAIGLLGTADAEERRRIAHSVRGTALSLGANRVAACAERIELYPQEDRFVADMAVAVSQTVRFIAKLPR